VNKHFECAFFKFFFRDMYSATITSFKQKELLMQFNNQYEKLATIFFVGA